MYETGKRVFRNALYNNISILLGALAGFFLTVYIARVLTPTEFGYYQLALVTVSFTGIFTTLGLHTAVTRFIADALKRKDLDLARSYFRYFLKLKFLLLILPVLFLITFSGILANYVFHKPITVYLQILTIYLFFTSFNAFLLFTINAFQDFIPNLCQKIIYEFTRATLIIILLYLGWKVLGITISLVIASFFSFLYITQFFLKKYKFLLEKKIKDFDKENIHKFIIEASAITVGATVFLQIDSILIGSLLPAKDLAFYRAALIIISSLLMITNLSQVLLPTITQMDEKYLQSAVNKLVKYTSIFALFFIVLLILFSHQIIYVVYGPKYFSSTTILQILSLLLFTNVFGFVGVLYISKEKLEYPLKVLYFTLILNVILTYIGVKFFGIIGASVAVVLSRYIHLSLLIRKSKEIVGVSINYSYFKKPLISSILTTVVAMMYPRPETLFSGIFLIFILAILYFGILYLIEGYDLEDIKYLLEVTGLKIFLSK